MIKQIIHITLILLGLFIVSCNNRNSKTVDQTSTNKPKITVYHNQIWLSNLNKKDLLDSFTTFIDTLTFNGRKNYIYCDSLMFDSIFYFSYAIESDSFFYYNEYCKTLDTIILDYEDDKIELIISDYDIENSVDEESHIYWNKKYGLISVHNYPWGALLLFDHEEIPGFAKDTFYDFLVNQIKERKNVRNKEKQNQ